MSSSSRMEQLVNRMRGVRSFTEMFLDGITDAEWFWSPPEYTTHLAWQVGHIAVAEYGLCMRRIRGREAADESLISETFIEAFKPGSIPNVDPAKNPPLAQIQQVFAAVHTRALEEVAGLDERQLTGPLDPPHPRFKTKLEAVEFSPLHELVHAGQIAMLRRLMGKPPLR